MHLSRLKLCAKYEEANLCGSWGKCDKKKCIVLVFENRKLTFVRLETVIDGRVLHSEVCAKYKEAKDFVVADKMQQLFL